MKLPNAKYLHSYSVSLSTDLSAVVSSLTETWSDCTNCDIASMKPVVIKNLNSRSPPMRQTTWNAHQSFGALATLQWVKFGYGS